MERDGNLYLRLLPAGMIIKDFVKGGGAYDYEIFLRELINQSHFFLEKSGGKGFTAPPSESHGEPDCISEAYTMDFKLAGSQSALKARSLLSSCRCIDRNGVMLVGKHSGKMASTSAVRIHSALRHCSMDDLKEIMRRRWDDDVVKHDIKAFLLTLQTRKNILLFFPYECYFKDSRSYKDGLSVIQNALASDLGRAMEFRAASVPDMDTYFSFIFSNQLVILDGRNFDTADIVPLEKSPAYARMSWSYDIFDL